MCIRDSGSTRTVTIADSENTSKMVQITFATYAWGFTIAPAMYMNNEIGIQKDFETKMMKYIYACLLYTSRCV